MTITTALLNNDRAVVLGSLGLIVVLAWSYMLSIASSMPADLKPGAQLWTPTQFVLTVVMWAVMMLPSAVPLLIVFMGVIRARYETSSRISATGAFLIGYLALWSWPCAGLRSEQPGRSPLQGSRQWKALLTKIIIHSTGNKTSLFYSG